MALCNIYWVQRHWFSLDSLWDIILMRWANMQFTFSFFEPFFFFSDFDLEKERTILDEQGLRIAKNQKSSQKNRRKLAESTRGIIFCSIIVLCSFMLWFLYENLLNYLSLSYELNHWLLFFQRHQLKISWSYSTPYWRVIKKRLIMLPRELNLGKMLFSTFTRSFMKHHILI